MSDIEFQTELPVLPVKVISTYYHGDLRLQWRRRGTTDVLELAEVLEDKTVKPVKVRVYEGVRGKVLALTFARACSELSKQ